MTPGEAGRSMPVPRWPVAASTSALAGGTVGRWLPPLPIAWLLALVLSGLVLLTTTPVLVLGYLGARDNTGRLLRDRSELGLAAVVEPLTSRLDRVRGQLAYLAQGILAGTVAPGDRAQMDAYLLGALAATPQLYDIAWVRPDLRVTRYVRPGREVLAEDWSGQPGKAESLRQLEGTREARWHGPYWSPALLQPVLTLVQPIQAESGHAGVLVATIRLTDFSADLAASAIGSEAMPFILLGRDRVLAHPRLGGSEDWRRPQDGGLLPTLAELNDPTLAAIWDDPGSLGSLAPFRNADAHWISGPEGYYTFVYRELRGYGDEPWLVGIYSPSAQSQRERWIVIAIGLAGILLLGISLLVAARLARRLGQPVLALAAAARRVENLDLADGQSLPRGPIAEVNEAMSAFERMGTALRWFETYLPRALVRRLIAADHEPAIGEEREVTILFTDLEGYTHFSTGRAAPEVAGYLNGLLERIGPLIEASGGTIDKYIGDAVMAFWGAPEVQPDHAARALRTAREIRVAVTAFNAARRAAGLATCRMRVGLHSGRAVVGNIGFVGRMNYTVVGEAVNVAQRLEQAGRHCIGTQEVVVLVSDAVHEAVAATPLAAELIQADGVEAELGQRAWCLKAGG